MIARRGPGVLACPSPMGPVMAARATTSSDDDVHMGAASSASFVIEAVIQGGPNADFLEGGAGDDSILGEGGNDTLVGDIDFGDEGNDTLKGGTDDDSLVGGEGINLLLGEDGNDVIF